MKGERKDKEKEKGERERRKRKTDYSYSRALLGKYSYRRATAGELILHYITVGPSPGIRNVILFARMVILSPDPTFPSGDDDLDWAACYVVEMEEDIVAWRLEQFSHWACLLTSSGVVVAWQLLVWALDWPDSRLPEDLVVGMKSVIHIR